MLFKKSLVSIICISGICLSAIAVAAVKTNDWFSNKNTINLIESKRNVETTINDLQPFEQLNYTPILTQKTGPIISWGHVIKSLDWFGAERWKIDLMDEKYLDLFPGKKSTNLVQYAKRAFINWDLDVKNNYLWLLMSTSVDTALTVSNINNGQDYRTRDILASTVVKINSLTGEVIKTYTWYDDEQQQKPHRYSNYWGLYYQINALTDGNILIFGLEPETTRANVILDTTTGKFKTNEADNSYVKNIVHPTTNDKRRGMRNNFLIPIAKDLNILTILDYNKRGAPNNPTGDVYLLLVKNDFSAVETKDPKWQKLVRVQNVFRINNTNFANTYVSQSIYRTFKDKVYFTIYNKFFVVDTKLNSLNGLDFATYDLDNSGNSDSNSKPFIPSSHRDKTNAISTFAVDANENVYYKLFNDSVIYNLKIGINENDVTKTTFASTTYYDLAQNNNPDVVKNAKSFGLFNVEGSTGSILALNGRFASRSDGLPNDDDVKSSKYGLALAIVPNRNNNQGDSLGLLNTDDKFIKPADFEIEQQTLKQKLPSEITRNDLHLKNGGFFTSNSTLDENNNLKYLPFKIEDINDSDGSFSITAYLDQIPWFANSLPDGFVPRRIKKEFKNAVKIEEKITWTKQENLDYNFLNTLPSKIDSKDLDDFDLFKANFASKTIVSQNEIIYPKKTYTVSSANDETGQITINVKYEYVPLETNYYSPQDVKTYNSSYTYTVFNNKTEPVLTFAGQVNNQYLEAIDIKKTPVLKSFLQSAVLPSSIQGLINSNQIKFTDFLNLSESKGYPSNKMSFNLKANDHDGTLEFEAFLPNDYYGNRNIKTSFKLVFNGFNKANEYSFRFKESIKDVKLNNLNALSHLPSFITNANVLNNFAVFSGFDVKDFNITLIPNDIKGELTIRLNLDSSYSHEIGDDFKHGFDKYFATKTYSGFLTQEQFNQQFNIDFVDEENIALSKLKEKTLLEIENSLKKTEGNENGLTVGENTYENLNDLLEKVIIASKGIQIPTSNWKDNKNIVSSMTYDNNAGTVAFFLTIKKEASQALNTDLNFVITYSGFARGNKVQTEDNLSFISNTAFNNLKLNDEQNITLENLKTYLQQENSIKKLFSSINGEYLELINNAQYDLKVETSSLYQTARIEITFDKLKDQNSLKTYSNTFVFRN